MKATSKLISHWATGSTVSIGTFNSAQTDTASQCSHDTIPSAVLVCAQKLRKNASKVTLLHGTKKWKKKRKTKHKTASRCRHDTM